MIKVIKNGLIITMNKNDDIKKADIVIKDNKIIDIIDNYVGIYDEVIDASNKIILPGLINTHSHLGMNLFKASSDNLTLDEWLNNYIWPIEKNLNEEDIYYSTLFSTLSMIKSGTTTTNEMYINNNSAIKAFKKTKIRAMYGSNFISITNKGDEIINDFLKTYNENKNNELINFSINIHSLYTTDKTYVKKCSDLAYKLNIPVNMHFCENDNEVKIIKEKYNSLPVDILYETGLNRNKLILIHCVSLNDYDINILKNLDVSIVHCPISNLNLGCGIANIKKYMKNFNISLGTDGEGSAFNINMFKHMSICDLLQRGLYKNPKVISSYDILKMATINGAKTLGMENDIGSIEINKKADLIILNLDKFNTFPTTNLINNIVHNVDDNNIELTMINGEILYNNNKFNLDVDIDKIKNEINRIKKSV